VEDCVVSSDLLLDGWSTQSETPLYFFAYAFGLRMPTEYADLFRLLDSKDDLEGLSSGADGEIPTAYREIIDRKAKELQAQASRSRSWDTRPNVFSQ
jgi:hypothetical protein